MALDTWDPRAAAAGTAIGYPAITSPYPQAGVAAYTDPVTRPVPTLTTLAPNTLAAAAAAPTVVTITGTNYTVATHVSFQGVIDHWRVGEVVTYISPTSLKVTLDLTGLTAATYPVIAVNQDGQVSTPAVNFTIT